MEGESLMNDGSSLVLFEVFLKLVRDLSKGGTGLDGSLLHTFGTMGMHIVWLSLGEANCVQGGSGQGCMAGPGCAACPAKQCCCTLESRPCRMSGCVWLRQAGADNPLQNLAHPFIQQLSDIQRHVQQSHVLARNPTAF